MARTPDTARVAAKREREKRMVSQMIALYCRRRHGTRAGELCPGRALPGVCRARGVRAAAQRPLPLHGDQDLLLQLPRALLQA